MTTEKNKAPTETTDKKPKESFELIIWLSFGFIVTFVLGYLGFLVYVSWPINEWSVNKAASLGDSFGILSSLFSGLAFAGLIVTIVMQNKTLKAQMEELELARKEYKRQGDALYAQQKIMDEQFKAVQLQNFESTLYKLIEFKDKATKQIFDNVGSTLIDHIQKQFSDDKVISRSQMSLFESHEFDLYIRRIIKLLGFFPKDDEGSSKSFFKDLVFDSFIKEEKKMLFYFLEKTKNKIHIHCFRDFLYLDIDFWALFKSNIIFALPNLSECDISDENDVYHALWKDHDHIIGVVENAVENSYKKCDKEQFIDFLNEYLKALHAEISSIETFELFDDHEFIKSMISMDDMNERVEEIKIKIDSLTPPES
jgi:hypothetical protein